MVKWEQQNKFKEEAKKVSTLKGILSILLSKGNIDSSKSRLIGQIILSMNLLLFLSSNYGSFVFLKYVAQ